MFKRITAKLKLIDYLLISLISAFVVVLLYRFLYPICGYQNLSLFMVSDSVYKNHNKNLDVIIFFAYILIFFCILPIFYWIKNLFGKIVKKEFGFNIPVCPEIPFKINYDKYKIPIFVLEVVTSFGYLIFYPFNGFLYKKLICLITILIVFSIFDAYWNLFVKEHKTFSIFAIAPIFLMIFGTRYDVNLHSITDTHHYGETYATFFLHNNFGLQYYKDIMLVHGYTDLMPSFLGKYIFNSNLIYADILGKILLKNIFFLCYFLLIFFIFKNIYFLSFLLVGLVLLHDSGYFFTNIPCFWTFYSDFNVIILFLLVYLALVKKELLQNPFKWLLLYVPISFVFPLVWTTYGSFWVIASLPLFSYVLYKFVKSKPKLLKWISIITLFLVCVTLFKSHILGFLSESGDYIHSNLISFGLDFCFEKYFLSHLNLCLNFFAVFIVPYFIVELVKELRNKDKNPQQIFVLAFCVIYVLVGTSYYLGRIGVAIERLSKVSIVYLSIFVPYLVKLKNKNIYQYLKNVAIILLIFVVSFSYLKISKLVSSLKIANVDAWYEDLYLDNTVKKVVNKYSKNNGDFYALLNNSMYYVYLNKKIPVKFVNCYNIVDLNLDKKVSEQLKNADISLILLKTSKIDIIQDNLFPSLRNNNVYRWMLLSKKFKYLEENKCVFLLKTQEQNNKFSRKELHKLDSILSREDLEFLPQAWGDSFKSLPVEEVVLKYEIIKAKCKNEYVIKFEKPIKGSDVDLVYLNTNNKDIKKNFKVLARGSWALLKFSSKSENAMFPLDNFPSWLLNDKIEKIYIKIDNDTEIKKVKFYKRK